MTFQNILDQNASPQCLMLPFHLQAYIPDFNVIKGGVSNLSSLQTCDISFFQLTYHSFIEMSAFTSTFFQ